MIRLAIGLTIVCVGLVLALFIAVPIRAEDDPQPECYGVDSEPTRYAYQPLRNEAYSVSLPDYEVREAKANSRPRVVSQFEIRRT